MSKTQTQKLKKIAVLRTDGKTCNLIDLKEERDFRLDLIRALTENGTPIVLSNFKREISLGIYEAPILSKKQANRLIKKLNSFYKKIDADLKKEIASRPTIRRVSNSVMAGDSSQPQIETSSSGMGILTESVAPLRGTIISSERLPHMRAIRQ